jgi:hypothetical protein
VRAERGRGVGLPRESTGSGVSSADHASALAACSAPGGRAASASTTSSARLLSDARGTTSSTKPRASASVAGKRAPARIACNAAALPTMRGKVWVAPPTGIIPIRRQRDDTAVSAGGRGARAEPNPTAVLHRHDRGAAPLAGPTRRAPARVAHREHARRRAELAQVGPGGEVVAGRGEQERAHTRVDDDHGEELAQLVACRDVVHVDRRVVELELHDRTVTMGSDARLAHAVPQETAPRSAASRCPTALERTRPP